MILQTLPVLVLVLAKLVQLRLSSLGLSPVAFDIPELPQLEAGDNRLANAPVEKIGEGDLMYPECLVLSPDEKHMFATLGDGRIVMIDRTKEASDELTWHTLARTGDEDARCGGGGPADFWPDGANMEEKCGRPLGLWMGKTSGGEDALLVADAYKGFLVLTNVWGDEGRGSKLETLATRAESDPADYKFSLLNAVVQIPSNGDVYITETSRKFQRRRIFHAAMDGTPTGRLLRYRHETGKVEVVADNIYMANGISLSHDERSLLIVSGVRVLRYDLAKQAMDPAPFVEVMPGTGDNIKTMGQLPNGEKRKCYWAGLGSPYKKPFSLLNFVSDKPRLRSFILAVVPYQKLIELIPKWTALAVYDEKGDLIEVIRDDGKTENENGEMRGVAAPWLSELEPWGGYYYLASWYNPFLARIKRGSIA